MASTEATPMAGYTRLDEEGRLTLGKPIRDALHLEAGSTLAWLIVGDAIMLVPADAHLAELMDAAATAFENAHLNLDNLEEDLASIREEIGTEHYGPNFFHELHRTVHTPSGAMTPSHATASPVAFAPAEQHRPCHHEQDEEHGCHQEIQRQGRGSRISRYDVRVRTGCYE